VQRRAAPKPPADVVPIDHIPAIDGDADFWEEPPASAAAPEPSPDASPAQPIAGPEPVFAGGVEGRLARVPVGLVQAIVGDELTKTAGGLRSAAVLDLMTQMRATDARCAPVYFTHDGDPAKVPALFAGLDSLAAAMQLGLDELFVITIPSAEAPRLQSALILEKRARTKPATDEDSLLLQVKSYFGS
jgi:hypothetical protein